MIIVPCFNELDLLSQKIKNTLEIDYPQELLTVVFVDGGSHDGTAEAVAEQVKDHDNISILQSPANGKINQINYAMQHAQSDLIVITDVDALMSADCIQKLNDVFNADHDVAVVGAFVMPGDCCPEEHHYWLSQNRVRILEGELYGAATVVGACYAFKRSLLPSFPPDVVADDIYISFLALSNGKKVYYCKEIPVVEVRAAKSMRSMVSHKFRKANAYITEILRFMHKLPTLQTIPRIIFISRALQIIGAVWIGINFGLVVLSLLFLRDFSLVALYFCIALFSLWITHLSLSNVYNDSAGSPPGKAVGIRVFMALTATLLLAALAYPFYLQNSDYKKVR